MEKKIRQEIVKGFPFEGKVEEIKLNKTGLINDTYMLKFDSGKKYVLQKVNTGIFTEPEKLMDNIVKVTKHLRAKIEEKGGDPERETMNVIFSNDDKPFYIDKDGGFWRSYIFVDDVDCYEQVENPEVFYETGIAFGKFQGNLSDFNASELFESIKDFHNTEKRFETFKNSVKKDSANRKEEVKEEIDFILNREEFSKVFNKAMENKEVDLRVTHNDTKLNNILMDKETQKGICVVDLDTVMPGLVMNDFGDAIRFGANTTLEDDPNLENVDFDLELFEEFTKGFLAGTEGKLTDREVELLPTGAKMMTFECAIRFLTDYLDGDVYFKVNRESHNLDRARNQIKLLEEMEKHSEEMDKIIEKYK